MQILFCLIIGYLLGSLSPAALMSKLKKMDLREHGTKNLGATNTILVFGKKYGIPVMVFDIFKAVLAVKLARILFPAFSLAGLLSGSAAVVGHIFPFYLKFKGGKGFAPFSGMVLAFDPLLFVVLLVVCTALVLIFNCGVVMPILGAVLFPILHGIHTGSITAFLIAGSLSVLMIIKHYDNIQSVRRKEDLKVRRFLQEHIFH